MRLIGIGLLAFLMAGVALFITQTGLIAEGVRAVRTLRDGPQLRFETAPPVHQSQEGHSAVIYRASTPDAPLILSGIPAYQGATFLMPIDARPTSGYLQIDATVQVLAGVEGVLRVSIDNTRRAEMLLRPGEAGRSMRIQLTEAEIARAELVVSFSLQGEGPHRTCSRDGGVAAVVEIETTSALFLTLQNRLTTPRDRIASWGGQVPIYWPEGATPAARVPRLATAARFVANGQPVRFVEDEALALTLEDLEQELADLSAPWRPSHPWAPLLSEGSSLFGLHEFHRRSEWRMRYDMRRGTDPRLPERLDLHMALGLMPDAAEWQIIVTFNGRMLDQFRIGGGAGGFSAEIDLPQEMAGPVAVIEVLALSHNDRDGPCNDGPELFAEVLRGTRLVVGETSYGDGLGDMRDLLVGHPDLALHLPGALTPSEALAATELLALILPEDNAIIEGGAESALHILARDRGTTPSEFSEPVFALYRDLETHRVMIGDGVETPLPPPGWLVMQIFPERVAP